MQSRDLQSIVRTCLGTAEYRRSNRELFIEAVGAAGNDLYDLLEATDMAGLFSGCLRECGLEEGEAARIVRPFVAFSEQYVKVYLDELRELGGRFAEIGVRPAVLKGPSYWGRYYEVFHERRVRDLDLLVLDPDELRKSCTMLYELGYWTATPIDDSQILRTDHYEFGRFRRSMSFQVDEETESLVDRFMDLGSIGPTLRKTGEREFSINMHLELHKSIFMLTRVPFPDLRPDDFEDWALVPPFRAMTLASSLPYLSVKMRHDFGHRKVRALKLLGDCVRLLRKASQAQIDDSVAVAERWSSVPHYLDMLGAVAPMAPEIGLVGVRTRGADPVEAMVEITLAGDFKR